jgi:hypothetical protein
VPRIDGAGRTAEVPEDPLHERRLLDAGDDAQLAAAVPAGVIGHIPVPDRFAAAFGRANRQSCRLVDVDGEHALEALRPGAAPLAVGGRCRPVRAGRVGRGGAGTIRARSGLAGANTPWDRVRWARGLGTSAARRAMKSSGSKITCVVPSRSGVFSV